MKNSYSSPAHFMNIFLFAPIRHFDNHKVMKVLVSLDLSQKIEDESFRSEFLHFDVGFLALRVEFLFFYLSMRPRNFALKDRAINELLSMIQGNFALRVGPNFLLYVNETTQLRGWG